MKSSLLIKTVREEKMTKSRTNKQNFPLTSLLLAFLARNSSFHKSSQGISILYYLLTWPFLVPVWQNIVDIVEKRNRLTSRLIDSEEKNKMRQRGEREILQKGEGMELLMGTNYKACMFLWVRMSDCVSILLKQVSWRALGWPRF